MEVAAIVMAAGRSTRFGRAKQLLDFQGQSLVRRSARAAIEGGCLPVVVVVGREREAIAHELADLPATILPNEAAERGIGTSIRCGVAALPKCDAVVLLACDQPHVDADLIRRMIGTCRQAQLPIVACAYAATLGVPVLFARSFFHELQKLPDSAGAKIIVEAHPEEVAALSFPAGAIDVDKPEDFGELRRPTSSGPIVSSSRFVSR